MRGSNWVHFIDNNASLASLINGSSSVSAGDAIVGETWNLIAALEIGAWFERVESHANPLDGLSRRRREGPWRMVEEFTMPPAVLNAVLETKMGDP